MFQKIELEKKKVRPTKRVWTEPIIRYHSITMPMNRKLSRSTNDDCEQRQCERTFITFENDLENTVFNSIFDKKSVKQKEKDICAITKLPARYFDPVTQLPFYSIQAFKILREAYYMHLEERGDVNIPEVSAWLEWRKLVKENRYRILDAKLNSARK